MEISHKERVILSTLKNSKRPLKVPEIAIKSGLKMRTTYYILDKLKEKNLVQKTWEGYTIKNPKSPLFETIYISYGILCVLVSVPLNEPVLTVFGSVSIILGKLARSLEKAFG